MRTSAACHFASPLQAGIRCAVEATILSGPDQYEALRSTDRVPNALLHSVWDRAMSGDLAAVCAAQRIVTAQAKLYGLTGKWESPKPALRRIVVVSAR